MNLCPHAPVCLLCARPGPHDAVEPAAVPEWTLPRVGADGECGGDRAARALVRSDQTRGSKANEDARKGKQGADRGLEPVSPGAHGDI